MELQQQFDNLQKQTELIANSLALKLIWESNMLYMLIKSGIEQDKAQRLVEAYKKYLIDYENQLENNLQKFKKS